MHFVYHKYAILGRETVYCRYELFTGKSAYHMNTFDVDWSPTIDIGHNKIDRDKLKDVQEREQFPGKGSVRMKNYFTNDDHKVCYYTGLPKREMLLSIFELVIPLPGLKREYY